MSGILGYFKDKNDGLALGGATAGGSHDSQAMRPAPANIAAANVTPVHEGGRPGSMSATKPAASSSSEQPYQSPAQQLARERAAAAKAQIAARKGG